MSFFENVFAQSQRVMSLKTSPCFAVFAMLKGLKAPFQSGGLLVKTFQPLAAEVHIHHLLTGLGSFGMGIGLGATWPRHSQRCGLAQALGHQGKSATGDEREAD